jgi:hypothetical protein
MFISNSELHTLFLYNPPGKISLMLGLPLGMNSLASKVIAEKPA